MDGFPKIKVCGVNDAQFAQRAEELGVDYLGFIFAEGSPRRITPEKAAGIAAVLSGKVKKVGVFTATSAHEILEIARCVPLDVVQLHSLDYGADEIQRLKTAGLEVWRLHEPCGADAVLLDGAAGGRCGGTGRLAVRVRAGGGGCARGVGGRHFGGERRFCRRDRLRRSRREQFVRDGAGRKVH